MAITVTKPNTPDFFLVRCIERSCLQVQAEKMLKKQFLIDLLKFTAKWFVDVFSVALNMKGSILNMLNGLLIVTNYFVLIRQYLYIFLN